MFTEAAETFPTVAFLVTAFCLLVPFRTLIGCCINPDEALENDKEYTDLISAFPTDYDKENPLTSKQGQLRVIDIQISNAKKNGDDKALAILQGQREGAAQ